MAVVRFLSAVVFVNHSILRARCLSSLFRFRRYAVGAIRELPAVSAVRPAHHCLGILGNDEQSIPPVTIESEIDRA